MIQALQKRSRKRLVVWPSHLKGNGYLVYFPIPAEHSANFMENFRVLGIVLGVEDPVSKYKSDMGSVPM